MKANILYFVIFLVPVLSLAQKIPQRIYKNGESYKYLLTTENFNNNQFKDKTIAVSFHIVTQDSGYYGETISWLSKTLINPKDTVQLDSIAKTVAPYRISLDPKGAVPLPALIVPAMTGEITDLNTFFVAVSPKMHIGKLSNAHPFYQDTSLLHGNFADGKEIIKGEDRILISQRLIGQTKKETIIESSFLPPKTMSLAPFIDTIATSFSERPNNFQMIRKGDNGKVNLLWGVEEFIITTTLDNRTGKIKEARMTNTLTLRMRYNCSPDLATYAAEFPLLISRELHLALQ